MTVLFAVAVLAAAIAGVKSARQEYWAANSHAALSIVYREDRIDRDLSIAAVSALGKREGAIIVMDPRTGRVRALVNPPLAFESAFAPGSTIKPFSMLAALRLGTIEKDSNMLCREHYSYEDFKTVCSHTQNLPPLKPAEALAYSCNYYFGKLGEQLHETSFKSTLAEFGFGQQTEINGINVRESAGKLPHGQWRAQTALGEGEQVQVTPIQLLTAYAALVNGGHLFVPGIASEAGFVALAHAELSIDDEHRQLIIAGMRGAVCYGTAEHARLHALPLYVFGKTGTATEIGGLRTQGWFVGFASGLSDDSPGKPETIELAVLVFLKKAHGADAAEIARPIFEAYIRGTRRGEGETGGRGDRNYLPIFPSGVRVHLVRENATRAMSLEDYVLGVVAAEGSTENETAALKALAVASRTYALKNLRRHADEGYDFCTTTHCQRYSLIDPIASGSRVSSLISKAVRESAGEVLQDREGSIVDSYFSASCGGATANIGTLWGVKAPSYLAGGSDEYCLAMPHHTWKDVISSEDLLKALNSDPRTDIGGRLVSARVARRDASGRAELITIEGARRRTVSGWDFKIIVGRALGWNLLKSSRYEISRSGSAYVFRGSGFGHGLGLCQEGAHVMARRGASYRQVLAKYFPGTSVVTEPHLPVSASPRPASSVSPRTHVSSRRRSLASEHFRVSYPASIDKRQAEHVLRLSESSRTDLLRRVSAAGVSVRVPTLELFINETTGDFVGRTGQPSWAAAATRSNRVELQPLELLKRRRILEATLRHEFVHVVIDAMGQRRTPRWLAEGLALHYAGEGQLVSRYQRETEIAISELEQRLSQPVSAAEMRAAYAAAYREVKRLIRAEGEAAVWRRASQPS